MKRLICMAVLAFAFLQMNATTTPTGKKFTAKTNLVNGKTIHLSLINLKQNYTKIQLTDLNETTEYYSVSLNRQNGFSKNLNLQYLKDGKYLLTIKNKGTTQKQVIRIKGNMTLISGFAS